MKKEISIFEVLDWLLKHLWVVVLVILVWFFARWTAPSPEERPPEVITKTDTLDLAPYIRDSLTNEIKSKILRILELEEIINSLLSRWGEVKPETVVIAKEPTKWRLKWEWIAHVERTKDDLVVVTFKIDRLASEQDSATIAALIEAGKEMPDSFVEGRVKKYHYKFKEREFVLTSKKENLFLKVKRESPFSSFLMVGGGWIAVSADFDGLNNPLDLRRFYVSIRYDFWIGDRLRLTPYVETKRGGAIGVDVGFAVWRCGRR